MKKQRNILELDSTSAKRFLLSKKCYCSLELPEYFDFQQLLDSLSLSINNKTISEISYNHGLHKVKQDGRRDPRNIENVNYKLYHNKDCKYAWRPFELIHPAMYICLVNKITEDANWEFIK